MDPRQPDQARQSPDRSARRQLARQAQMGFATRRTHHGRAQFQRPERARFGAIEVQLAAYGLTKTRFTVDALVRQANSRDHAQKIWALWTLGLLGNRGVETDRVVQVLTAHLKDSGKNSDQDEDARRWAVEGLALVGTTSTIVPLLNAMHNDPRRWCANAPPAVWPNPAC